jgi:hypothetical protein
MYLYAPERPPARTPTLTDQPHLYFGFIHTLPHPSLDICGNILVI